METMLHWFRELTGLLIHLFRLCIRAWPSDGSTREQPASSATLNPAVAAALHNANQSRIYSLPDELFVAILSSVADDPASFFCLRQVSYRFRRIVDDYEFREHPFTMYPKCSSCSGKKVKHDRRRPCFACLGHNTGPYGQLPGLFKDIKSRLRRDLYCKECQHSIQERENDGIPTSCKFAPRDENDWLYCSGCAMDHPSAAFSPAQREQGSRRTCVGMQGHVRLCQHKVISWADVQACVRLDGGPSHRTIVVCKHADHVDNCWLRGSRSLPTAYVSVHKGQAQNVILRWNPHTGIQGYCASDVRAAARRYRADAAPFIAPEQHEGHLPEMECFKKARDYLYNNGLDFSYSPGPRCISVTSCRRNVPQGKGSCLSFSYRRYIYIGTHLNGIPSHEWFHALDRTSYEWQGANGVPETCADSACRNHYCVSAERTCTRPRTIIRSTRKDLQD
ncbi:hypothetical protein ACJZ2D_004078 [Fusarium nematophilum]